MIKQHLKPEPRQNQSRRDFLTKVIPSCTLACAGLTAMPLLANQDSQKAGPDDPQKHKFERIWPLSYEDVFRLRFVDYIDIMQRFAGYLGREKLLNMIKQATDESLLENSEYDPEFDFSEWIAGGKEYFKNTMTWEIVEETDRTYEMKATECLWAKIFMEYDAADIGYATVCYSDYAYAKATHPNLRMERTKTIMQGHGYCNHRWTLDV